ncbi:TerD family protein [Pseudoalteromonas sp. SWYJZ19]|uniref:TerD family protein n=1 Tax=Pseudoalteromonas sp. SWYJZ19 TaxID=2792068 RepID=UPI0018CD1392|nr:TerD family protein [Pseudoalteromonas sp. SWYJZ19]MBH0048766.1 TerD family protein [Pseudoalteromonas sp. SWYJZ19]
MAILVIGSNTNITQPSFTIEHTMTDSIDVSVFCLGENGKVHNDNGMVFYGAPKSACGTVTLQSKEILINLDNVPSNIEKFAIAATMDNGTFATHPAISFTSSDFECQLDTNGRTESALILLEVYKRNNSWKIKFVGQGFNGGLKPLAEHYGVDIADEPVVEPSPPKAAPVPKINLSKINLTKSSPKVDLTKKAGLLGLIKVNLNWEKGKSGFFSSGIDLDLGAYIELKNGEKSIIQALGNRFEYSPYIKLLADDRTGDSSNGEWIHIDGNNINNVKRIIVFSFIYSGSPNWDKAKAVVTLHVPDMPPIETQLNETSSNTGFCAIAELTVENNIVAVERLNRFFKGHADCDKAYGWGFKWSAGSK